MWALEKWPLKYTWSLFKVVLCGASTSPAHNLSLLDLSVAKSSWLWSNRCLQSIRETMTWFTRMFLLICPVLARPRSGPWTCWSQLDSYHLIYFHYPWPFLSCPYSCAFVTQACVLSSTWENACLSPIWMNANQSFPRRLASGKYYRSLRWLPPN